MMKLALMRTATGKEDLIFLISYSTHFGTSALLPPDVCVIPLIKNPNYKQIINK